MSLLRQSSLTQLKRIDSEIKKQGGQSIKISDSEKKAANSILMHDVIDSDKSGKRKIATYDQMFSIDIPESDTKIKNEMKLNEGKVKRSLEKAIEEWFTNKHKDQEKLISEFTGLDIKTVKDVLKKSNTDNAMENLMGYKKDENVSINKKNIMSFDKMFENGPNDTPQEIMKNMKTINNWFSENTPKKEINQLIIGKQIDTGKVKGFVNRVEGTDVYIDSIVEPLGIVKIKLKDAIKGYKPEKQKNEHDMSIEGPNNKSLGSPPKTGGGYSPKVNSKSNVVSDQKISNKNNKENSIKKFSDMSKELDSKTITTKNKPVSTKINKFGDEAKDTKSIANKIYKDKKITKLSNLSQELSTSGKIKKSQNEPGTTIDKKSEKSITDNNITKKNTKIKKFSNMKSDIQIGPKSKK